LKELLTDWHDWLPLAGVAVVVLVGLVLWLRRKPEDAGDVERQRRAYLNRVGRIVEGQVLEIVEHARDANDPTAKQPGMFQKRAAPSAFTNGTQKLTGLDEAKHLGRVAAGQTASVKYDPSNPSNSILLADDWSGLH
jgi:hypothetical protein